MIDEFFMILQGRFCGFRDLNTDFISQKDQNQNALISLTKQLFTLYKTEFQLFGIDSF